jgi:hypothetical protein
MTRLSPRSLLNASAAAGLVGLLALTASSVSGTSPRPQPSSTALIGDGVCAAELQGYGYSLSTPASSVVPAHGRNEAIAAAQSDIPRATALGVVDAYLAVMHNATPLPGRNTNSTLTWVVEINGLDYPYSSGFADHSQTVHLHHVLDFIDANTLTPESDISCQ